MAVRLASVVGRLLAAGSPNAIKTIKAGLMLANSPVCLTLPEREALMPAIPRAGTDAFSVADLHEREPLAKKAPSAEERALKERAELNREQAMGLLLADGWRHVDSEGGDQLFAKTADGRTVWKFRSTIDCGADAFAEQLIHNCDSCPSWNKAIKRCRSHRISNGVEILDQEFLSRAPALPQISDGVEILHQEFLSRAPALPQISDGVEILHQETGQLMGGLVTRREFVNLRQRGRRGKMHYSAVIAIEHRDFPLRSGFVRGENFPTVFTVRPCGDSADRCIVEGTLNCDLKLRLVPTQLIERGMRSSWRQLRSYMLGLAERVRRQPSDTATC